VEEDGLARLEGAPSIRKCVEADLDKVLELERISFKFPYDMDTLVRYVELGSAVFLVCEVRGNIIGYIISQWQTGGTGSIVSIAVSPAHRNKGIGSILLDHAIAKMRDRISVVELQVSVSNADAVRFYQRRGFRVTRVLHSYYPDREAAFLMTLRLQSDCTSTGTAVQCARGLERRRDGAALTLDRKLVRRSVGEHGQDRA